ncbi:MAG: hypothetical protein H0U44_08730, partial [Flavisolibacter sp.]|nr:hypothetical protein [Flavisolibacter sp.]
YLWCLANPGSYEFDDYLQDFDDADSAARRGFYNRQDFDALVEYDPFFSNTYGSPLKQQMKDSLMLFSRTLLKQSAPDKNILEFIDMILYCKNQSNPFDGCTLPEDACRSPYQEWILYRNYYLNLKLRLNEEARRTSENSVFANCSNCYIGDDVLPGLNTSLACDSLNNLVREFRILRSADPGENVTDGKYLTQSIYQLIKGANALLEARQTYPSPVFSDNFCFDNNAINQNGKLNAVKRNSSSGLFHVILPLSLNSTQLFANTDYVELKTNQVLPEDFCTGNASATELNEKYYAVAMRENTLGFKVIWSDKNSSSYAYYGTSSPLQKYLPFDGNDNHVFNLGFIIVPDTVSSTQSYLSLRSQLPLLPRDTIKKITNLRFDEQFLPDNYNSYSDLFNASFLKVTLELVDGSNIDAHVKANYENTSYIKYKQVVDSNLYNEDCETAFTWFYNNQFGSSLNFIQIDSIYQATCRMALINLCNPPVQLFTDSTTCNNTCTGGIYTPYDRSNISYFIHYGDKYNPPADVPEGYAGCQFYSVFEIKTAQSSSCRFYNVWVCILDSAATPGSGNPSPTYSSECKDNPQFEIFQNKIRRYSHYINPDALINNVLSNNPVERSDINEAAIINECRSFCQAQADGWIATLSGCNANETNLAALKQAFIVICQAGCSPEAIFGASSAPAGSAAYNNFEDAIAGILVAGAINDQCTAELLAFPYPHNKQPGMNNRFVYETNYDICSKIGIYQTQYQASGFQGSLHAYLKTILSVDYVIDSIELDNLLRSCTGCNGIVREPVILPIAFEPGSRPCLNCADLQPAYQDFQAKYNINESNSNYSILLTNYLNHRFGFALAFTDYKNFLDSCNANSGNADI